ncbi:uncharacterized protein LOC109612214 [Musca domestica]|uniref:Uncharacterized protein LOC109612214 n=1 Tax=Musca domestica TaxID=7370 RepID=A0A9J7DGH2_MUSDO|nr:uncharacterized protein LOC109612214 [Musca domestica]
MLYKYIIAVIAFGYPLVVIQSAQRRFDLEVQEYHCTNRTSLVRQLHCNLTKIANGRYYADFLFEITRNLDKEARIQFTSYYTPQNAKRAVKFVDLNMKVCDVLSQSMTLPLIKTIINEVRKTSNLPYACPIKGNFTYKFVNLTLDANILPTYTPLISYNFSTKFYEHQKLLAILDVSGATVARSKGK